MGNEDCLYLNIWTPKNANLNTADLPVLVFIYGGSFTGGSANSFDGEYLSGEDAVFVTFNYRYETLAFILFMEIFFSLFFRVDIYIPFRS